MTAPCTLVLSASPHNPRQPRRSSLRRLLPLLSGLGGALLAACGPPRDADGPELTPPVAAAAPQAQLVGDPAVYLGAEAALDITVSGAQRAVFGSGAQADDPGIRVIAVRALDRQRLRVFLRVAPTLAEAHAATAPMQAPRLGGHTLRLFTPSGELRVPFTILAPLLAAANGNPSGPPPLAGARARLQLRVLDTRVRLADEPRVRVLAEGVRASNVRRVADDRLEVDLESDLFAPLTADLLVESGDAVLYLPGGSAGALRLAPSAPHALTPGAAIDDALAAGANAAFQIAAAPAARVAVLRLWGEGWPSLLTESGRLAEQRRLIGAPADGDGAAVALALLPAARPSYVLVSDGRAAASTALPYRLDLATFPVAPADLEAAEDPAQPAKLFAVGGVAYLPSQPSPKTAHYYALRSDRGGAFYLAPGVAASAPVALEVREGACADPDGKLRAASPESGAQTPLAVDLAPAADYCVAVRTIDGDGDGNGNGGPRSFYSLLLTPAR